MNLLMSGAESDGAVRCSAWLGGMVILLVVVVPTAVLMWRTWNWPAERLLRWLIPILALTWIVVLLTWWLRVEKLRGTNRGQMQPSQQAMLRGRCPAPTWRCTESWRAVADSPPVPQRAAWSPRLRRAVPPVALAHALRPDGCDYPPDSRGCEAQAAHRCNWRNLPCA